MYWGAWRDLAVQFPNRDALKIPEHWKLFGARNSPVSNAPRKACNPANAMLNFLYTMLESETRLTTVTIMILGRERQIRAFWADSVLVVEARSEVSGNARRIEARRSMDPGGEWLTIERLHEQPGGAVRQHLRMRPQLPEKPPAAG